MMKKSIGLIALLMVAIAFVVAPAAADIVSTEVTVQGCGYTPVIKCKWEQDCDSIENLESGDPSHVDYEPSSPSNSQFMPECGETTQICIAAVAMDKDGIEQINLGKVHYKVTGPCGLKEWEGCLNPCTDTLADVEAADAANLITYSINPYTGEPFDLGEIQWELNNCNDETGLFCNQIEIGYCDPAGEYTVEVWATDVNGLVSDKLTNTFTMLRLACCEYDFESIVWDNMVMGGDDVVRGDVDMTTAYAPTVKNLGNVDIKISVKQDPLMDSTGKVWTQDCNGEWCYEFDASLLSVGNPQYFYPDGTYEVLDSFVERCGMDGICFSLHILQAMDAGAYSGQAYVECSDAGNDPCAATPVA